MLRISQITLPLTDVLPGVTVAVLCCLAARTSFSLKWSTDVLPQMGHECWLTVTDWPCRLLPGSDAKDLLFDSDERHISYCGLRRSMSYLRRDERHVSRYNDDLLFGSNEQDLKTWLDKITSNLTQ